MEKDSEVFKKNRKSFKRFVKSFKYSGEGIKYCFYHEQNIIVMLFAGIVAIILGLVLKVSYMERLVILLLIGMVLALELVNTAIEAVVNLHDGDKRSHYGKVAKDCASGAVSVISIFAFIIGVLIFIPKIIGLF